jgi:phosphoribosylformylglycinamidine cyclo-ligase
MVLVVAETDLNNVRERLEETGEIVFQIGRIESGERGCTVNGSAGSWSGRSDWIATHNG